jgi:YVTN family beta-propeller protein
MKRVAPILLLAALVMAASGSASAAPFVYVSNIEGSVSVIDSANNEVTATIPGGGSTNIAFSPDGKFAYVGIYYGGAISVIDTETNAVTNTISVGTAPWGIAFTPDGKTAYVTDEALNVVWVIDTSTKTVVGSPILLGTSEATEITITPDGGFVYVVSICGASARCDINVPSTVSIIDTSTNTLVQTLTVGTRANGIAITNAGDFVYVANQCSDPSCAEGGSVSVISTASQTVTETIPIVGEFASQFITITPDDRFAFVANTCGGAPPPCSSETGTVSIIDLTTNAVVGSPIRVGKFPAELGVTPDGSSLYVVNQGPPGSVSAVATTTNKVVTTIPIGDVHPAFMAISPPTPFSQFGGNLRIDPDAGIFYLAGGFELAAGANIDAEKQSVVFRVGSYAVTLPVGSFVEYSTGYVYQRTVNGIFLCIYIKFTSAPGSYQLLANRKGGTLTGTTSPVPVTLTIGDDSGSTLMNASFY